MLGVVWMIIIGFIVGALARWIYPGAIHLGFWMTALLGIAGSIVGGVIGSLVWRSPDGHFRPAGLVLSVIGALIVLWAWLNLFVPG